MAVGPIRRKFLAVAAFIEAWSPIFWTLLVILALAIGVVLALNHWLQSPPR
jgi:hypothetical protein